MRKIKHTNIVMENEKLTNIADKVMETQKLNFNTTPLENTCRETMCMILEGETEKQH